jgi:hypothetical protein
MNNDRDEIQDLIDQLNRLQLKQKELLAEGKEQQKRGCSIDQRVRNWRQGAHQKPKAFPRNKRNCHQDRTYMCNHHNGEW